MKTRLCITLLVLVCLGTALVPAADNPEPIAVKVTDDALDFAVGPKKVVARYHKKADVAKPYLWPILGPGDVRLTRSWPMEKTEDDKTNDHVHQKSMWFCHGEVVPEGMKLEAEEQVKGIEGVDFWSENPGHGVITCTKVGEPVAVTKEHSKVATHNEWRTAKGRKLLDEDRTIHFYGFGDTRLYVFDIDLHASVCPITFGDTKEGSFGVRINDAIREEIVVDKKKTKGPGQLENAEGKVGESEIWGRPSAWCDYSGPLGGKTVGLAILTDPTNKYPSCWHSRGYGLMAANPFGRAKSGFPAMKGKTELVKLEKGEHLKLRFGILTHPGDAKEGKVAEYYDRFVKAESSDRVKMK